jgi:predicted enzyme involved in methoxymalonyl-ACP biosynthesis
VLKEEDISIFVANRENKADGVRLVQKTLNIGFDSLVFLDDTPSSALSCASSFPTSSCRPKAVLATSPRSPV